MSRRRPAWMLLTSMVFGSGVQADPTLNVHQLDFLTGHWVASADGVTSEQVWLPSSGGTVMGMLRRVADGEMQVSYFFVVEQSDAAVIYRFKHFNADYTTYEDRNGTGPREFELVSVTDRAAVFRERVDDREVFVRYRVDDRDRLGIAVGSSQDLDDEPGSERWLERRPIRTLR